MLYKNIYLIPFIFGKDYILKIHKNSLFKNITIIKIIQHIFKKKKKKKKQVLIQPWFISVNPKITCEVYN